MSTAEAIRDNTDANQVANAFRTKVAELAQAQGLAADLGDDIGEYIGRWLERELAVKAIAELNLSGTGITAEELLQHWSHVSGSIDRMLEIARERLDEREALTSDHDCPIGWIPLLYRLAQDPIGIPA